jgi:hypothetical protein
MAFQANKANVGAFQHPRIRRTMRLMTRLAAFKTHGRMFEGKWTPFIAMALEASRLIRGETLQHRGPDTAVGVVAVYAIHVPFGKLVMEGG